MHDLENGGGASQHMRGSMYMCRNQEGDHSTSAFMVGDITMFQQIKDFLATKHLWRSSAMFLINCSQKRAAGCPWGHENKKHAQTSQQWRTSWKALLWLMHASATGAACCGAGVGALLPPDMAPITPSTAWWAMALPVPIAIPGHTTHGLHDIPRLA